MPNKMRLGTKVIADVMNPQPDEIDLEAVINRISNIKRFAGHPDALTVMQHCRLVKALAVQLNYPWPVIQWAFRHDWHEAITGDIPAPVKDAIYSDKILDLEWNWDCAIARACNIYPPSDDVDAYVAHLDLMARRLEMELLGMTPDDDLPKIPGNLDVTHALAYAFGHEVAA